MSCSYAYVPMFVSLITFASLLAATTVVARAYPAAAATTAADGRTDGGDSADTSAVSGFEMCERIALADAAQAREARSGEALYAKVCSEWSGSHASAACVAGQPRPTQFPCELRLASVVAFVCVF